MKQSLAVSILSMNTRMLTMVVWMSVVGLGCSKPQAAMLSTHANDASPQPELGVHFVKAAAQGDVATLVREARTAAHDRGERLLVYVGATWCEPCGYFHRAVERGDLRETLSGLTLLEFDLDRDQGRLEQAGYKSPMIPLLVVPDGEGRGTEQRLFGSIHGEGAVKDIVNRLQPLLRAL